MNQVAHSVFAQYLSCACVVLVICTAMALFPPKAIASPAQAGCVSLDGKEIPIANAVEVGHLKHFVKPELMLFRCQSTTPKGTVMLCPGGGYSGLEMKREGENTAHFLNEQGFDVALLEYHIDSGPPTRALALADALQAFRLLKSSGPALGLHNGRMAIMGYSAGGHLAARTVQNLAANEQPDDLILIYPAYLNEEMPGTVLPAVMPPQNPGRLFALIATNDKKEWVSGCSEYAKTWKGYDGSGSH